MSSFTPGPWEDVSYGTNARNGIAHVKTSSSCEMTIDCTRSGKDFGVDRANARLVAAAPDLLEALRKCAAVCSGQTMHKSGLIDALESARAAIAKATGAA